MAGYDLKPSSDGIYYIHWTDPTPKGERGRSKRVSTGHRTRDEAEDFLAEWLTDRRRARATESTPTNAATVADIWEAYDRLHVQRKPFADGRAASSWKNLKPHFGALAVSQITQATADAYKTARSTGAIGRPSEDSTIRQELIRLLAALRWAAKPKQKIITPAVLPVIDLPAASEPRDAWLRPEQVQSLATRMAAERGAGRLSRVERFFWIALFTGSRKTAILELTWDRVDFEQNVIHFHVPGAPRTSKRRASVPIAANLRPILLRARSEKTNQWVLDHKGNVWSALTRIGAVVGVEVYPHLLRHTAATWMARDRVPLWFVSKILANTLKEVEKTYAKHIADDLQPAVDMIGDRLVRPAVFERKLSANEPQDVAKDNLRDTLSGSVFD